MTEGRHGGTDEPWTGYGQPHQQSPYPGYPPQQSPYPGYPPQQSPGWQQDPPPRPWYKRKRFNIPLGILAFLTIVGIFAPKPDDVAKVADSAPAATKAAETPAAPIRPLVSEPAQPASQPPAAPQLSLQDQFISLVVKARESADRAENDFQKRLPLTNRNKAFCKLLKSKTVSGWTGEVKTLDTNGDGLGVLVIQIADDVQVGTWNNALSDIQDNTLIATDSQVFEAMSTLSEGDRVAFKGTFIRDPESCIGEQSITDNGSTQTPTFTMRFSKLVKA